MAKIKTFVSNQGEIFEGTLAELCREYGITQRKSITRATGAPDSNGDRWKEEGGEFKKTTLYLGIRREQTEVDGEKKTYDVAPSETAGWYVWAQEKLEGDLSPEDRKEIEDNMKQIEATHELVENHTAKDLTHLKGIEFLEAYWKEHERINAWCSEYTRNKELSANQLFGARATVNSFEWLNHRKYAVTMEKLFLSSGPTPPRHSPKFFSEMYEFGQALKATFQ